MKRIAIPAMAAGLLLATSAMAADYDKHPDNHGHGTPTHSSAPYHGGSHTHYTSHGTTHHHYDTHDHGVRPAVTVHVHVGAPLYRHDAHGYGIRPANWNDRPRVFDRGVYQRNFVAANRFHFGVYVRPSGWYYRRWGFGEIFPRAFWARNYWIDSYWMYDLMIPPYGYEWVRYGSDAVLIDAGSGQIMQVEYGVFY